MTEGGTKVGIRGIIFDLDGVLVHTDQYHFEAWKRLAGSLGIYFDEAANARLRGVGRMESLEIILERYSGPPLSGQEKCALAEGKNRVYQGLLQTMNPNSVALETVNTLSALKGRGYRLAVGSSSRNAKTILDLTGLGGWFDAVSDGVSITRAKPDPEVFLKAAQLLGLPPGQCAVVEDAASGIEAACAAGMLPVGIGGAAGDGRCRCRLNALPELLTYFQGDTSILYGAALHSPR